MPVPVIALVAVLLAAGCGLEPAGVRPFERAALVVDAGATPPGDADPRWREVALPDHWRAARRAAGLAGWYRVIVELPAQPEALWAIGLPLVVQNAAVRVNGERVGNGGPFAPTMARNWNRPLFVTVPPGVLHAGRNVVHVRLASQGVAPPILGPIYVGPAAAIEPPLARRAALQVGVARATTAAGVVLLGLLALLLRYREYFVGGWWFLAALALLTASSADGFVHVPPVSTPVWDWLVTMLRLAAAAALLLGAHRHLGLARPRVEGVVWLAVAACGAALALVPPSWALSATLVAYGMGLLLGLWALGLLARHRRRTPPRVAIGFLAVGLVCLLFALHDLAGVAGYRLLPLLLVPYAFTLVVVVEAGVVVGRLVRGWGDLVALNRELEARVAAKHAELEETWERVRGLERERVVADERRRITRDIHDGLGGHLVTTLAMLESADEFSRDDVAEALRGALDDLRLVIDSLDPQETDLVAVLATVRSRIEPRLRRRGVRFAWDVAELPPSPGLGPERLLRVLRVVQEAITNVLKHARATTITVRTGVGSDARLFVTIRDDGCGFVPDRAEGRGLVNMRRRAAELGGTLDIETGRGGTSVTLRLSA